MIKRIFWDIDETLIHTEFEDPGQEHISFATADDLETIYYTMIRPCAHKLIMFSQGLVGADNVYILTAASKDYAISVNKLFGLGVNPNNILSREDMQNNTIKLAYGGKTVVADTMIADANNVLIDNLEPRYNFDKINFIGMGDIAVRYIHTGVDYLGVNKPGVDDVFYKQITNRLIELYERI